ncbi:hypothetical protein BH11VER1_BH11VER1_02360 [soil metagenome]
MTLPLTRHEALSAWQDFLPKVSAYSSRRNHVEPAHHNVSRLSAALRYRLITEDEILHDTLQAYDFSTAEKWLQEVCWRRYWKGWLEMRPGVWSSWRQRVKILRSTLPESVLQRAEKVAAGESGVACMDAIAHELITTGYLHNHARMWWASFWIHAERLPWELGAEWFFRHLLDADPASNTLSWRWVAGLQTPGKTYLVKKSNIEKYAPELLLHHHAGSDRIADGAVSPVVAVEFAETARQALTDYSATITPSERRVGLWLHADDLHSESGPLANLTPVTIAAFSSEHRYRQSYRLSERRIAALGDVLADGLARASVHFQCPALLSKEDDPAASICAWAATHGLQEVAALAPTAGPVADLVPRLRQLLTSADIKLTLLRRASDAHAFTLAGAGFFPFWEKMSRHLHQQSSLSTAR